MRGAAGRDRTSTEPVRIVLIAPAAEMSRAVRSLIEGESQEIDVRCLDRYPGDSTLREITQSPGAVCLLDVASDPAAADALIAKLAPVLPLAAVLPANDPDMMLRALRRGATGFLIPPYTPEQLRAILAKAVPQHQQPSDTGGPLVCVVPGKGAAGATTLACNLAIALGKRARGRVLLADLDRLAGTVAFVLKLRSTYSFADALQQAGPLDAELWKALVVPCQGIDVLLAPENPIDGAAVPEDPGPILDYALTNYDVVVADCGSAFGNWNAAILKRATGIVLVSTQAMTSVHGAQRALAAFENLGIEPDRIGVVVNRVRPNLPLTPERVGASVAMDLMAVVPDSPETIQKALIDGKAAAPASRYGAEIAKLAERVSADEPAAHQAGAASALAGWLSRLCG